MTEYQRTLFLIYFKDCSEVDFHELNLLLGLNGNVFDQLIREMIDDEYIAYDNYKLRITDKGIRYLISKDQIYSQLENDDFILRNISPNDAFPMDKPYVPKNFLSKVE